LKDFLELRARLEITENTRALVQVFGIKQNNELFFNWKCHIPDPYSVDHRAAWSMVDQPPVIARGSSELRTASYPGAESHREKPKRERRSSGSSP
jgi:hypothetical protein